MNVVWTANSQNRTQMIQTKNFSNRKSERCTDGRVKQGKVCIMILTTTRPVYHKQCMQRTTIPCNHPNYIDISCNCLQFGGGLCGMVVFYLVCGTQGGTTATIYYPYLVCLLSLPLPFLCIYIFLVSLWILFCFTDVAHGYMIEWFLQYYSSDNCNIEQSCTTEIQHDPARELINT